MSARDQESGTDKAGAGKTRGGVAAAPPAPWMLRQKVTIPDCAAGYLHRPELVDRAMPTRRRVTVLMAPGGFGKTTLLAECCRGLRRDGVPTAWVSLDEQDEPAVLDTYIAFACRNAGLDSVEDPEPGRGGAAGDGGSGRAVRARLRRAGSAEEPGLGGAAGLPGATRTAQPASGVRLQGTAGRREYRRRDAGGSRRDRDGRRAAVLGGAGCGVLRFGHVAQ